jgi:predicted phage-related endonuclease
MPRLTDAQVAAKRHQLGASDFASLAGVGEPLSELYLRMIGELDPEARIGAAQRAVFERGHRLEDVALGWYADDRGVSIERIHRDVVHPRLPFVVVHPDARVKPWRQTKRLVEAKTTRSRWDALPQRVEAQVQAQMAATGADVADVAALSFDGLDVFEVPRNNDLIRALEQLAVAFMDRVERRDPPPMDGSPAESRWLDRLWAAGGEVIADADQARTLARVVEIREQQKALEAEGDRLVDVLKFSLAGASRLIAPGVGKVLWTAPSSRSTTAWKEVAAVLGGQLPEGSLEAAIEAHTRTDDGIRQFRITPAKEAAA